LDHLRIVYLSIGGHIHTKRWINYFVNKGHKAWLLTVQPEPIPGVEVIDIRTSWGPKPFRYAISLAKVKRLLRQIKPDILHTHFLTGYGYWGAFSGFHPFIMTVWGDDVYTTPFESKLKLGLAKHVLKSADWITGDSDDILRDCIELGAPASKCTLIQWGVDFKEFHPGRGANLRAKLGIAEDVPVVLSTRSFTQDYYNIDVIIESLPLVREKFPNVLYLMAGLEGSDGRFREMAGRTGAAESMRFLGRIPHDELPDYVAASDVFVTVPSVDATAVSLLEAMACGSAIVVTNLPSATEWISDGVNGEVIAPRDVRALAEGIVKLAGNRALRKEYGDRCVEIVRSRADHAANMEKMEGIYRRLLEGRAG
jgi:glycosyltransferase involved in cell wall biosynthesis